MVPETMPIMSHEYGQKYGYFPMALFEPCAKRVAQNHGQTLRRLAERGGLAPQEAVFILMDQDWNSDWPKDQYPDVDEREAHRRWWVYTWEHLKKIAKDRGYEPIAG